MSLVLLNNGWKRFDNGRIWRCIAPHFLVELDREGYSPDYIKLPATISSIRKIKAFYSGKLSYGLLDTNRNGLDIMVANSLAESYGTVPTPFSYDELKGVYQNATDISIGIKLSAVVDYIQIRKKSLVRKEPGYIDPISTPSKISLGAHHCLISTALNLTGVMNFNKSSTLYFDAVKELVFKLPSTSAYAAQLAIKYFNNTYSKHQNEPPLLAAIYNAGSLRPDATNVWNLKQYGNHLDRWVSFYNTSRVLALQTTVSPKITVDPVVTTSGKIMEIKVLRKEFSDESTIGELFVNEEFHCYTLEDFYREDGSKVFGKTAIPEGRYQVIVNHSNHFKKEMPLLISVPGYEGVRIHPGNTAADTLGCVLVGKNKGKDVISNCAGVFESLLTKIKTGTENGKCHITIKKYT